MNTVMLTFETTHEYYLGPNASLHYCSEHEALILTKDYEDRVLINGISNETMLEFASKTYKDSLVKQCIKDNVKDAAEDKDAENPTFHMDQAFDKAKAE